MAEGTGDIEERLVDGEDLDEGGEVEENLDDLRGGPGVLPVVADHQDDVWAFLPRLPDVHAGLHAEGPRLVGTGGDDRPLGRADDRNRLAAQRRVGLLLHRGEKGVHVDMEDDPLVHIQKDSR